MLVEKPKAHALLDQMRLVEVFGQTENFCEKIAADFDCGLADAASELFGLFHDKDAEIRAFAQQEQGGRCAGERAANESYVVMARFGVHEFLLTRKGVVGNQGGVG